MEHWTTRGRPAAEQFGYWREVICEAFTPLTADLVDPRADPSRRQGLPSWVTSSLLTTANAAEVSSRTQRIRHGAAEIGRTKVDHVFVNLVTRGRCRVTQGGRTTTVPAGGFSLVDTSGEYVQDYIEDPGRREWRAVSFRVPRTRIAPLLGRPEAAMAVSHGGRLGGRPGIDQVAVATMLSVWRSLPDLDEAGRDAAESALVSVIAASAGASEELHDTGRDHLDAALRTGINRYVDANLRTGADLSAGAVARRFGVSVRKLHTLYAATESSFGQTVMRMRVDGCARELVTPGESRSVTDLATRWGFTDLSHLNRVFKAHHDCRPSQYREEHRRRTS